MAPPASASSRHPPRKGEGWDAALRFAMRAWGMAPREFWRLSLREWRALTAGDGAPLGVAEMEALMRKWPDAHLPPLQGQGGRAERGRVGDARSEAPLCPTPRAARSRPPHEGEGEEDEWQTTT
jgi:uncharacterized phage protein (TIGR02216 family)